jgi:hypothetical protein
MIVNKEVTQQRRTIMGQIDYSLQFINSLKKQLMDVSHQNMQMNWAVGGFVMCLLSGLLHEIQTTILSPDEPKTATENLIDIKQRFNNLIDLMLENHIN